MNLAIVVCELGFDGWVIGTNYLRGSGAPFHPEVVICDPENSLTLEHSLDCAYYYALYHLLATEAKTEEKPSRKRTLAENRETKEEEPEEQEVRPFERRERRRTETISTAPAPPPPPPPLPPTLSAPEMLRLIRKWFPLLSARIP